jgi:hypothetical protein
MPAAIDISFQADLSNLTKQLARMPEITKKEAKEMVKALETQFKKAEKAAERAAKKTEDVFNRTGKGAKAAGKAVGDASGELLEFGDTAGDADSALKAIGGAIGLVSPEAERAFSALGDLSGGAEGLIRTMKASVGPFAIVAAAVAAGAFAWNHYRQELEKAEEKVKDMAAATAQMQKVVESFKADRARIQLEFLVAAGEEHIDVLRRTQAMDKAKVVNLERVTTSTDKLSAAKKDLNTARLAEAKALKDSLEGNTRDATAHAMAKKATAAAEIVLKRRTKTLEAHTAKQNTDADLIFKTGELTRESTAASKSSAKATKEQVDATQELIDASQALIPALPRTEIEKLSDQLGVLMEASLEGGDAIFQRLTPSMSDLSDSIQRLTTEEAAADLDKLTEATAALTEKLTPLDKATQQLDRLNAAAAQSDDAARKLAPDIDKVSNAIDKINTDNANEQLRDLANPIDAIAGPFQAALSNLGQLNLDAAMKEGGEALDDIGKRAEALEGLITGIDERIKASTDERVIAQLESEKALIEGRIEATAAAKEQEQAMQNEAIAKAFKLTKALNLSEIAMNTATAVMKAYATLGFPAAVPISAGLVALGATQAALVASQEPPSLHLGGMIGPDERTITARTGEGVLTQQGVAAIGGASGLNAANRGAGTGAIVVQQVYKHRVLDVVLTDSIQRGGPITAELNKRSRRGRRNPHRRAG